MKITFNFHILYSVVIKHMHLHYSEKHFITVKPETLTSQKFDKFGKSGSNRQTLTFQSKATKHYKHLQII